MKKIALILLLLLAGFAVYWFKFRHKEDSGPKQEALKVGKHSEEFKKSVDSLVAAYTDIHDALVNDDTAKAKTAAKNLIVLADSNKLAELKKDTTGIFIAAQMTMESIQENNKHMIAEKNIADIRADFRDLSENMYTLLKTIRYEGKTLYWQNCPMAFGEGKDANWISNTEEIVNPYLGKNHPEFKSAMLHCGEVKDSIKAQ